MSAFQATALALDKMTAERDTLRSRCESLEAALRDYLDATPADFREPMDSPAAKARRAARAALAQLDSVAPPLTPND